MAGSAVDERPSRGRAGEDAALRVYERRGYRALARNWRCALGELDLVVQRKDVLVFCEVKSRRGAALGGGYEAVTRRKQAKLRAVAEAFLQADRSRPQAIRFDVASVAFLRDRSSVEVFEEAF